MKSKLINGEVSYKLQNICVFDQGSNGDWIESDIDLSNSDDCWISGIEHLVVYNKDYQTGNAQVSGNAYVFKHDTKELQQLK